MTSLTYPQKTVGAHTVHSVPNLDYWRNLVLDYLDDSDDMNLYFAAQKLNVLVPEDPVGLYGLACAQRYRGELNTAYFNVIQARRRLAYNSGFPVTYEEALELEAAIAVDLGHIATAIDRYGELIDLNPLEPNYVSARAKLFDTAENMTVSVHKRRQGQDDSSLTDAQTSLFLSLTRPLSMQPRRWGASEIFRRRRKVSERDMPNCNPLLPMLSVEILCVTNGGNFVFTFCAE